MIQIEACPLQTSENIQNNTNILCNVQVLCLCKLHLLWPDADRGQYSFFAAVLVCVNRWHVRYVVCKRLLLARLLGHRCCWETRPVKRLGFALGL